jgi:hypothetical protein
MHRQLKRQGRRGIPAIALDSQEEILSEVERGKSREQKGTNLSYITFSFVLVGNLMKSQKKVKRSVLRCGSIKASDQGNGEDIKITLHTSYPILDPTTFSMAL